jgi:hypothetical protein
MARIQKPINESAEIQIESVEGSLQIKGWDQARVSMEADSENELHYTLDDNSLTLSADGDCLLRVPKGSGLHIETVSGNTYIQDIEGEVHVENVDGSLTMKNVGETHVVNVAGNLSVRGVEGDMAIDDVAGNMTLRDVEGEVKADDVHGNLSLRNIEGSILAKGDGNVELRLEDEGNDVTVEAAGNIFCSLEDGADAEVVFESGAQSIRISTNKGKQLVQGSKHVLTLGDGGMDVSLNAGGYIDFRSEKGKSFTLDMDMDFSKDVGDLAEDISEQVSSQVEAQLESLNEQLEGLAVQLKTTGDRSVRHAQRKVAQAKRQLERRLEHQHLRGRGGLGVMATGRKAEPVSEKERMLILQMVQEKKISVEQAEMLLNTLEGRPAAPAAPAAPTPPEAPTAPSGAEND